MAGKEKSAKVNPEENTDGIVSVVRSDAGESRAKANKDMAETIADLFEKIANHAEKVQGDSDKAEYCRAKAKVYRDFISGEFEIVELNSRVARVNADFRDFLKKDK